MKLRYVLFISLLLFSVACTTYQAKPFEYPNPVDTTTKAITQQEKKKYDFPQQGISADNLFDGARLNNFESMGNQHFRASIAPENYPINPSAYYAFRLSSNKPQTIKVELNYTKHKHRYHPKISKDGKQWELLEENLIQFAADSINVTLTLSMDGSPLWVAGQEITNSSHVKQWCEEKANHGSVLLSSIGKSKLGKDILFLDIHEGDARKRDVIVVLSRQHPPEVTGYFAMQAFIDELLADHPLANMFRKKYRILVYPLMNPDGVDLGHWRHSAGGIDLNRDWGKYNQPENRQVVNHIVKTVKQNKSDVILGLDFHSTWRDVYYTNKERPKHIPNFKDYWLWGISQSLGEETNERPSFVGSPVSKNWFNKQFGAMGIVYEIGDSTPRDFIKTKGKISATEMMELLIFKE